VAKDFEWPVDELKVFVADSKSENRRADASGKLKKVKDYIYIYMILIYREIYREAVLECFYIRKKNGLIL
jgi:hypothetical protein